MSGKVRLIYDDVQLFKMPEIQKFTRVYWIEGDNSSEKRNGFCLLEKKFNRSLKPLENYDLEKWMDGYNRL